MLEKLWIPVNELILRQKGEPALDQEEAANILQPSAMPCSTLLLSFLLKT